MSTDIPKQYDVAVIGCGLMGSALARAFASQGRSVAAWNRTYARAEALASERITPVADVTEAVTGAALVVACPSSYDAAREALAPVADWNGTTLVSVGTSTSPEADALETWAHDRGATYLDGAILCYPHQIGGEEGQVLFSGASEVWDRHRETLMLLGSYSAHVSEQARGASVIDNALVGAFYSSALAAYVEAATYALDNGVPPASLKTLTELSIATLGMVAAEAVDAIAEDRHETDQATLSVYAEGTRATLAGMRAAGYKVDQLAAATATLAEGERAGLGHLGVFALTKVARNGT